MNISALECLYFSLPIIFECCMVETSAAWKVHTTPYFRNSDRLGTGSYYAGFANQRHDSIPLCISFSASWWSSHSKDSASTGFLLGIGANELPRRYARQ